MQFSNIIVILLLSLSWHPWLCVRRNVVLVHICPPRLLDHIRSLLGHHHDRRYGIAVGPSRKHGRVHHPQVGHTEHPELRVDHRLRIVGRSHLASPRMMIFGLRVSDHHARPIRVRVILVLSAFRVRRNVRLHVPPTQCSRAHQSQHYPDAVHHGQHVPRVLEVIRLNDRVVQRISRPQSDVALAPCQQVSRSGPHVRPRTVILPVRRAVRIHRDLVTVGRQTIEVHLCVGYLSEQQT